MVHISDGVLSLQVIVAGWILTAVILAISLWWSSRRTDIADMMPRLSLMTAAFFVASLVHIPVGPTSVHLILNGMVGIVLGVLAFPSIFIGLVLQAFLFQHGGITTIGVNTVNMGVSALVAYGIFKLLTGIIFKIAKTERGAQIAIAAVGGISGGISVALAAFFTSISLLMTGEKYHAVAMSLLIFHIPVIAIEAIISFSIVFFLIRVEPKLLPIMRAAEV